MYQVFDSNNKEFVGSICEIIKHIKQNSSQKFYKTVNKQLVEINNSIVLNTEFICHRVNEITLLNDIDEDFGVEVDIRDNVETAELILVHDPYCKGEKFENYIQFYKNKGPLILNIKSERTEIKCLEIMQKYTIANFFFLDSSFPMINLLNTKYNCNKFASRFSEHEIIEFTENIKNMIEWVWVDCFTKLPLDKTSYQKLRELNKKICIVSPELQGQPEKISEYRSQILRNETIPDAICCKKSNIIEWL
jgi:hypothetical protein